MPFINIGENKNVSPSGKEFTDKQVKLYYATDGFKKSKLSKKNRRKRKSSKKNYLQEMMSTINAFNLPIYVEIIFE